MVFLAVGVTTPLGILAVNASAFIMGHLAQFRVGIAVCALISGLSLNGLGAYTALVRASVGAPRLYAEYRHWLIGIAVAVVVAWSAVGAWLTYLSMQDPRRLPNLAAVLTALWLLFLPFAMSALSRRLRVRRPEDGGLVAQPQQTADQVRAPLRAEIPGER